MIALFAIGIWLAGLAAKDDATLPDTVEKVAERLAKLEATVAEGFHENKARFAALDARLDALDRKIDISVESLRGDFRTLVEIVTGFMDEMRRTTASMRKEHAADREILRLTLLDQGRRITRLESKD